MKSILAVALASFATLVCAQEQIPVSPKPSSYLARANTLLEQQPVIDTHNDWPIFLKFYYKGKLNNIDLTHMTNESHTDIERLRKGHVGGQFWSIFYPCEDKEANQVKEGLELIDLVKRMVQRYPDTFQLAGSVAEYEDAIKNGRIASMQGIEGGQIIDSSMSALRQFYDAGVRYMTLTHNCHTPWAESQSPATEYPFPKGTGLTDFGRKIVKEMNRIGMFVDISHVAHSTMHAVLDTTSAPVLFSHTSANAICPIERNVPDSVLRRLNETDGVVMVNFYSRFVECDESKRATLSDVADHIEHIASIAGRDKVGLGSDYNGIDLTPVGLEDVSKYPYLIAELLKRGWSDEDVKGVAGANLLRIWRGVELVRDKLSDVLPDESELNADSMQ
ncbi:hypothetical protein K450DRAFT_255381 [Umbelopsis ramanniana AG]|uniref:Dipeptidase n=1 Tax=Umbelopsis ramanniana AG TaxID=1314678 RepID=A0AAD5E5K9_UMBRA|nr:uncharacterized protein K450DRAFT_255381 [Umbelopsis ramanniana AG]KAI8576746.1 hypothetical protein K450DRAFT_255381 [Umbelopsis ramanniana AG]